MNVLKFTWKSAYPFRYYLIGPLLMMAFYAAYGSLRPYLLKLLIDAASQNSGPEAVAKLWEIAPYFIALLFAFEIACQFYDWCDMRYKPAIRNYIAEMLVDHLLKHDYRFFQTQMAGNITAKVNDLVRFTPDIIKTIIDNYLTNIFSIFVAIGLLWQVHAWFAIGIFIWTVIFIIISVSTISKFDYLANNRAEAAARITGAMIDIFSNVLNVKLFARKLFELSRLESFMKNYYVASITQRWFLLKVYAGQGLSYAVYQTLCIILLIRLFGEGTVTPGDFGMILSINLWVVDCIWDMSDKMRTFSEHWGSIDQALKTLYAPIRINDKPDAKPLVVTRGAIEFDRVEFKYNGSELLFKQKSIMIPAGQKVGLVGYSGSGKSTFVNLILRLFDVTSGRITIDGQDIRDVTQASLHSSIGTISQDPSLFHRSVMENIRYGKPDATDEEVQNAAKEIHAHDFIMALPEGYNSLVGERGTKLSGGQRQRISIARAIIKNAPILILDEATSQLDTETERFIQDALKKIMPGKTALVIAHRLSTLLYMDRILVFDQGKIIQDGTHQELITQEGLYKKLWTSQVCGMIPDVGE
jgi:ATP-binding cassette subfamily B protein